MERRKSIPLILLCVFVLLAGTAMTFLNVATSFTVLDEKEYMALAEAPVKQSISRVSSVSTAGQRELETTRGDSVMLPLSGVSQMPDYPNGCEAASLTAVLRFYGYQVSIAEVAYDWLPREEFDTKNGQMYGPDPEVAYAGDPADATGGYYCLVPALMEGAEAYLDEQEAGAEVRDATGIGMKEIMKELEAGNPVIAWTTLDYGAAEYSETSWILYDTQKEYTPYSNLHCVVVIGHNDGNFLVSNPQVDGVQVVPRKVFWHGFEEMGSRAVIIEM